MAQPSGQDLGQAGERFAGRLSRSRFRRRHDC
jgi:hypothetical protein